MVMPARSFRVIPKHERWRGNSPAVVQFRIAVLIVALVVRCVRMNNIGRS